MTSGREKQVARRAQRYAEGKCMCGRPLDVQKQRKQGMVLLANCRKCLDESATRVARAAGREVPKPLQPSPPSNAAARYAALMEVHKLWQTSSNTGQFADRLRKCLRDTEADVLKEQLERKIS